MRKAVVPFSDEVADQICDLLESGESLNKICSTEGMPCRWSVNKWRRSNPEFNHKYNVAMEIQAEMIFEDIIDFAKSFPDVNRARLVIDTKKWCLARMHSKYRQHLEVTNNSEYKTDAELERIAFGDNTTTGS